MAEECAEISSSSKNSRKIFAALLVSLGCMAALDLLILIPGSGLFLTFTLAPLLSGYLGARYKNTRTFKSAVFIGIIWSCIQTGVLIIVLNSLLPAFAVLYSAGELLIISMIFVFNISFSLLGCRLYVRK